MSKHLSPEQLLRHLDGELSPLAAWKAAAHLKTCWACQVQLDHLKEQIAAMVDAQTLVLAPSLPPPPGPWARLEPRLERASTQAVPAWKGIAPFGGRSIRANLAYASVAIALAVVGLSLWFSAPPVFANEVLARVKTNDGGRLAARDRHVVRQRVRVVKTSHSSAAKTVRVASWQSPKALYWESGGPIGEELKARYESCGLKSALPLSPAAMEAWVQTAGAEPSATRDRDSILVEVASEGQSRAGGLERVRLHVKEAGWHLDEMTLTFADATFEITEEESTVIAREQVPSDVMAHLERAEPTSTLAAAVPEVISSPVANPVNLDDLEMQVRRDLHQIGADLGEAIEIVAQPPGRLRVEARWVSPETRQQLTALLGSKPGVQLEFDAPGAGGSQRPGTRRIVPQASASQAPQDPRLEAFFGSAEAQEQYTRNVLETSNSVLSHLYALQELSNRWPADQEPRLSASARAELNAMVRDHASAIEAATSSLHKELAPLLQHFGLPMTSPPLAQAQASWRDGIKSGLDAAQRVNRTLRSMLTTSDSPMTADQALPRLRQGLGELQKTVIRP